MEFYEIDIGIICQEPIYGLLLSIVFETHWNILIISPGFTMEIFVKDLWNLIGLSKSILKEIMHAKLDLSMMDGSRQRSTDYLKESLGF